MPNKFNDSKRHHIPDANIIIPTKDISLYDEQRDYRVWSKATLEIAVKDQMAWQKKHGYGQRAHEELAMQRYKRTFVN